MDLEDSAANSASPLDREIVEGFLKTLPRFDKQQVCSVEEIDEVDETSNKKDKFVVGRWTRVEGDVFARICPLGARFPELDRLGRSKP